MAHWFNNRDIKQKPKIKLANLHGYILPHAGTKYTGEILSHTLRFRPTKNFDTIVIIYLPANNSPDMGKYHHEYAVPFLALKRIPQFTNKKFIGYNMLSNNNIDLQSLKTNSTLFVISADFSHHLQLQPAIHAENCAVNSIMHRVFYPNCTTVIDDARSFKKLYSIIPRDWVLQWVGRTRSLQERGVGYCSFLIRSPPDLEKHNPNGFFITAYDKEMNTRECLGNIMDWSMHLENLKLKEVVNKARTTSRLTGGKYLNIPVTNYTVTYLYREKKKKFIRGWHAIYKDAIYLPEVFLENTYNNGSWIKSSDKQWPKGNKFKFKDTIKKLYAKANKFNKNTRKRKMKIQLFYSNVYHGEINSNI